eukprot:5826574-Amphidinium_carterae.1
MENGSGGVLIVDGERLLLVQHTCKGELVDCLMYGCCCHSVHCIGDVWCQPSYPEQDPKNFGKKGTDLNFFRVCPRDVS